MKLVTFEPAAGGAQSIGILDGDQVAVLDATLHPSFTSMLALIEGGAGGRPQGARHRHEGRAGNRPPARAPARTGADARLPDV